MLRRVAGACAVAALCAGTSWTSAAAETSVVEVGWWTRSPAASAPEGGFLVGDAPDDATSVAAIRVDLGRGVTEARLTLRETDGFLQDAAAVRVCRGSDSWSATAGGAWDDSPETRCGTSDVRLSAAEERWSADITSLVRGASGPVTVVLLPAEGEPSEAIAPAWEVQFEQPTFDADEIPAPTTASAPSTMGAGGPDPGIEPRGSITSRPTSGGSSASIPTSRSFQTASPASSTTTTSIPAGISEPDRSDALAAALPAAESDSDGVGWGRGGLFVLVAAAVGTGAGFGRHLFTERVELGHHSGA